MGITFAMMLWPLFAEAQPEAPEVKYNVALIAAGGSLAVALLSALLSLILAFLNRKNQRDLELLKSKLDDLAKEKDAQRDYEYEARKRLYSECEPLLFRLAELSENATFRIYSLTRTARHGNLPDWLIGDGYYKRSTMYHLIAPLVILRLIQSRLTFVDLTLDQHIARQYALLKLLYLTFTDDYTMAQMEPPLPYNPNVDDWEAARRESPQKYWRQGLYLGALDNTIDALLTPGGNLPWMSYGEFEAACKDATSRTYQMFRPYSDVLDGFHPQHRPVFWRILTAQHFIYEKILQSRPGSDARSSRVALRSVSPAIPIGTLDWRARPDQASDDEALAIPRRIADDYLRARLPAVFGEPRRAAP